jgi:hypothetical protein
MGCGIKIVSNNLLNEVVFVSVSQENETFNLDDLRNDTFMPKEIIAPQPKVKKVKAKRIFKDDDEVKMFIGNFKLMHPDFVDAVGSGIGLQLQGFDGAVTHQVLRFAEALDLPLIPIHEEYLVQEGKKEVIEEILKSSMQVVLQRAGQYGNLNAKWTNSKGLSSKVTIDLTSWLTTENSRKK